MCLLLVYYTLLARFVHGHRLIQVLYTFCINFIFIFYFHFWCTKKEMLLGRYMYTHP